MKRSILFETKMNLAVRGLSAKLGEVPADTFSAETPIESTSRRGDSLWKRFVARFAHRVVGSPALSPTGSVFPQSLVPTNSFVTPCQKAKSLGAPTRALNQRFLEDQHPDPASCHKM